MAENLSTRCLRLKVRPEAHAWLNAAAVEVNQVWNWANETSEKAVRRFAGPPVWLTGFDLNRMSAGASKLFAHIGADTIQRVGREYATKRRAVKKVRLSWRKSGGSRRSLGWVPFRADNLRRKGNSIRFCGKAFRVFEVSSLDGIKWRDGQFAQDAVGDWWLCLPVQFSTDEAPAPREIVGIDLGLKDTATTSDGDRLAAGRYYRETEPKIAQAQRRGHKKQAKRLHRKAARQRMDTLQKFTTGIVRQYQNIIVGDVSSTRLAKTRMAKSVMDSGWGMLKQQLQYKGQWAGRAVEVVNEAYTTRACSSCGSLSGPSGLRQLVVREWQCGDCGALHDRDVNAARNIANLGSRRSTSVCGNESHRVEVMA
jgi:putative transposase